MDLKSHIRQIPDFPRPGILFYDISTLLMNGPAWSATVDRLCDVVRRQKPDMLVGTGACRRNCLDSGCSTCPAIPRRAT